MSKFLETKISGQLVYKGFLEVHRDIVKLPNGHEAPREFLSHPGASMIIPILDNGHVLMERQFRYATGEEYLEFPAGKIDPGESALETAQRELLEETGYEAMELSHLTSIQPGIGYSNEVIEIFVAKKLVKKEAKLDFGEFLEVVEVHPKDLMAMVQQSAIRDVKTQLGAFWLEKILNNEWVD